MTVRTAVATVSLVAVVAFGVSLLVREDPPECYSGSTTEDVTMSPGGPETPEEALADWVKLDIPQIVEKDPAAYDRIDSPGGGVSFKAGNVELGMGHQPGGWYVGSILATC